jgi:hypothetical protein
MATLLAKPDLSEIHDLLRRRNALIVHFSGAPKGAGVDRGAGHLFPVDLQHVIAGHAMGGVSCSVIRPGDVFHGFERSATGCIGVLLGLKSKDSLVAVDRHDCGFIENASGIRIVQAERDITPADLASTLNDRDDYNEWIVRDSVVLCIFAAAPYEVSILKVPDYPPDIPDYMRDNELVPAFRAVSWNELMSTFPNQPIYSFDDGRIIRRAGNGFHDSSSVQIYSSS